MTTQLKITDGSTTVDLISGVLKATNNWTTKTASDGEGFWETFEIIAKGTDANVRTAKINFDTLIEQARIYRDKVYEATPVWLYWQSEGETYKQALVLDGESEIIGRNIYTPLMGVSGGGAIMRLTVLRHVWEAGADDPENDDDISTLGGTLTLAPAYNGTSPGRITLITFSDGPAGLLNKVWCGIRPTRLGTANFISVWEAEDGTNATDATDTVDATASGGNNVTINFGTTTTLAKRFSLSWGQVKGSSPYDDIIGRYLVLGRVKLSSAATEVAVQLRHGWGGLSTAESIVGTTYLSAVDNSDLTNWNLVELGVVDIPPSGNRDNAFQLDVSDYFLILYAEQLAGASLLVDCFVLIPAEHFISAKEAYINNTTGELNFRVGPDDFKMAYGDTGSFLYNCEFSMENWEYPINGGILVFAGQATSQHNLSEDVDIDLYIRSRWKSFYGT